METLCEINDRKNHIEDCLASLGNSKSQSVNKK